MAETDEKPKRKIRKIETVREKTVKTAEAAETPSKVRQTWRGFTAPARAIGRGIAKIGHGLARYKIFRIIGRILLPRYFRNSWRELRQVTWLTFKQSRQLTVAVVMFAVIFGVFVAVLDFGLDKVFKQVLIK